MIDDVFAVIADPTRRQILRVLAEGESPVGALVAELGVSQPTVSKHLKVLRTAGLVSTRAQGQRRLYSLIPEPLVAVTEWVEDLTSRAGLEAPAQPASSPEPAVAAVPPASGESAEGANGEIIAENAVSEKTAEDIAELTSSATPAESIESSASDAASSEEVIIADSAEAPEPEIKQSVISQPVIDQNRGIKPATAGETPEEEPQNAPAEPQVSEESLTDADSQESTIESDTVPEVEAPSDAVKDVEASTADVANAVEAPGSEYNESTEDALQNLIASVEARLASSEDFAGQEFTDFSDATDRDSHAGSDIEEAAETYEPTVDDAADDTLHQIESHTVEVEPSETADAGAMTASENGEVAQGTEDAVSAEAVEELVAPAVETADPVDSQDAVEPENREVAEGTETAVSEEDVEELIEESTAQSTSAPAQHAVHFTPLTPFTPSAVTTERAESVADEDADQPADSSDAAPSVVETSTDAETETAPEVATTGTPVAVENSDATENSEAEFAPAPLLPSASAEAEHDEENQRGLLAAISRWGRRRR